MRRNDIKIGLDIGSSQVRIVVAMKDEGGYRVLGTGKAHCSGLRKGIVVSIEETTNAINRAAEIVEKISGVPIDRAVVNIGGNHLRIQPARGAVSVSKPDGDVEQRDVERALATAQSIFPPETSANREIIHIIPRSFSLDNQGDIRDPVGMNGMRLEVNALIVTGSTPFNRNLGKCVAQAGIEIESIMASPLAAAEAVLNRRQKELGVAVVDIGSGTTDLAVFEEEQLLHMASIPLGSSHITNDIAIGLKTSIEVAEKVKLEYGSTISKDISSKKEINLSKISKNEEGTVKAKEVAEIIEARMEEILGLVNKELRKIRKDGMLPAGIVLTGGGAKLPGLVDLTKKVLRLPAQIGFPVRLGGVSDSLEDPSFAVVTGLVVSETQEKDNHDQGVGGFLSWFSEFFQKVSRRSGGGDASQSVEKIKEWFKTFLP